MLPWLVTKDAEYSSCYVYRIFPVRCFRGSIVTIRRDEQIQTNTFPYLARHEQIKFGGERVCCQSMAWLSSASSHTINGYWTSAVSHGLLGTRALTPRGGFLKESRSTVPLAEFHLKNSCPICRSRLVPMRSLAHFLSAYTVDHSSLLEPFPYVCKGKMEQESFQ